MAKHILSVFGPLLAFGALGSCGSAPKSYVMPDGRTGQMVECSGVSSSWTSCYADARKACSGNYEVVRQTEYPRGFKPVRELEFSCAG